MTGAYKNESKHKRGLQFFSFILLCDILIFDLSIYYHTMKCYLRTVKRLIWNQMQMLMHIE